MTKTPPRYRVDIPSTRTPNLVDRSATDGEPFTRVEVYHAAGGMNYFNYKTEPRGIYLSVTPVRISEHVVSFGLGDGRKWLVEETTRLNSKKVKAEADRLLPQAQAIADAFDQLDFEGIRAIVAGGSPVVAAPEGGALSTARG